MKQTILITGASSGIGKETAKLFQSKSWNIVATMRNPEKEVELSKLSNVLVTRLDVLDLDSIDDAIQQGIQKFGKIDVLLNNAGYGAYGPLESFPRERVLKQFNTNVIGLIDVTRAILPHFRQNKSGTVNSDITTADVYNGKTDDETDLTTNPNNQGVYKITPTGEIIVETTGIITSYQKKFALDPGGQAYWVNGAGQLRRGPGRPKLTSRASTIPPTTTLGQSVILGPDRSIYFLQSNDTDTSRVRRLNPANNESKVIGTYGTGDGQTRNAKGIALCRSGSRDAVEIIDEIITESNDRDGHSWIEPAATQGEAKSQQNMEFNNVHNHA
jgi:hypothetical protein